MEWEGGPPKGATAIELGFGAGNDTLELLRRGWRVLAVDEQQAAARFLARRVPRARRAALTTLVAPMQGLVLPPADLVYASFSLPFCGTEEFPGVWAAIRRAVRPGGHFAGQLFGDRDAWHGERPFAFHSRRQVLALGRGFNVELLRETVEEGRSFDGPKHWHYFDVVLEKPRRGASRKSAARP